VNSLFLNHLYLVQFLLKVSLFQIDLIVEHTPKSTETVKELANESELHTNESSANRLFIKIIINKRYFIHFPIFKIISSS
jgi:hypothetical protein